MLAIAGIGLLIGVLLGLTGAGGSIFAVPLLMVIMGMTASGAMGVALGAVAASAIYGTVLQRQRVLWLPAAILAGAGMLTAPLGKYLANLTDERVLVLCFSLLSAVIAMHMLRQAAVAPEATKVVRADSPKHGEGKANIFCRLGPTGQFELRPRCLSGLIIGGLFIGFASGFFGVGGGFLMVPLLLGLSGLPMHTAVASSLFSIALISSAGFMSHVLMSEQVDVRYLSILVLASIIGMLMSRFFGKKIVGPRLQQIFSLLLLAVSVVMLMSLLY